MTVADIEARTAELVLLANTDPDAAAIGADGLRIDVLQAIADGASAPVALAAAALRTVEQDVGGR